MYWKKKKANFPGFFKKEPSSFSVSPHTTNGVSFIFVLWFKIIIFGLLNAYSGDTDNIYSKNLSHLNVFTVEFNAVYFLPIVMEHKKFWLTMKILS